LCHARTAIGFVLPAERRNGLSPAESCPGAVDQQELALVQAPKGPRPVQSAYAPASLKVEKRGTHSLRLQFAVRRKKRPGGNGQGQMGDRREQNLEYGQFSD